MRVYGYLRFSFLGRSDVKMFRDHSDAPSDYAAALFDPDRMEKRFYLFETFCLPSLRHQTDSDFEVTILVSELMPVHYLERLREATSGLGNIKLVSAPASTVKAALDPVIRQNVSADGENSVHFRLDDDDALPVGFIEILKSLTMGLEAGCLVSLPRGYALLSHKGIPYMAPHFSLFHARGWARINGSGDARSPYDFGHHKASKRFKSVLDPRPLGYIATFHNASDSSWHRRRGRASELIDQAIDHEKSVFFERLKAEVEAAFPWIGYDGLKSAIAKAP